MVRKMNDEESLDSLKRRLAKAKALLAEFRTLFPEAHAMPKDDRRRSQGRMGDDESVALQGVIDAIEVEPALFASLADEDEGYDPNKLETELLRDRFARRDIYASLAEELDAVQVILNDTALSFGAMVKPVSLAAYEIAKPISRRRP